MHKAGRYTAALLLITVGGAVIADKLTGMKLVPLLIEWWPVLFISLGLEYIFYNMKYKEQENQLKLDVTGVVFAVVISAVVIVATQSASVFKNFEFSMDNPFASFGDARKFEKGITAIALPAAVDQLKLDNTTGNVTLQSGAVDQIQVELTVYVNLDDESEAAQIAQDSKLEHQVSGNTLTIKAAGKEYQSRFIGKQKPRMDLVVTMPEKQKLDMELVLTNGKVVASRLPIKERFTAQTTNGEILVSALEGTVSLETTNGHIGAKQTTGIIGIEATNGKVDIESHNGNAKLNSTNGKVVVKAVTGAVEAETTNGSIEVDGAAKSLRAHTTNGSVEISASVVEGDWDVETDHGKIELKLPSKGNYKVVGETGLGSIKSELPFTVNKKSIQGSIGAGTHTVKLETNGSIDIRSTD
jgi:DUF4097 and DUF4098 domain-containing protein YvlB